ncbi:hypothetical protein TRFO_01530 [Tritrichomonas foetus]|uniref:Right handed beta helix domain-containing protein n=1 Tax=Tritrichomonas foetus TaxID=1144522 RepID=A0A1J4K2W0_9EUKA|nr:hypothetical protein TRFO_01530 [Tritrichomonas foetus]|eukprot:OHT03829.1 hypothetical protein TRFO_01530 [Tritrichomonas foetus]
MILVILFIQRSYQKPNSLSFLNTENFDIHEQIIGNFDKYDLSNYFWTNITNCFFHNCKQEAIYIVNGYTADTGVEITHCLFIKCDDAAFHFETHNILLSCNSFNNAITTVRSPYFGMGYVNCENTQINFTLNYQFNGAAECLFYRGSKNIMNDWNLTQIISKDNFGIYIQHSSDNNLVKISQLTVSNCSGYNFLRSSNVGYDQIIVEYANFIGNNFSIAIFNFRNYSLIVQNAVFVDNSGNLFYTENNIDFLISDSYSDNDYNITGLEQVDVPILINNSNFYNQIPNLNQYDTQNEMSLIRPNDDSCIIDNCIYCAIIDRAYYQQKTCIQCQYGYKIEILDDDTMGDYTKCTKNICEMNNCRICMVANDGKDICLMCEKEYIFDSLELKCHEI